MNKDALIGISTLSVLFDMKQYERTDLLIPFVKYAFCKKYEIGDYIDLLSIQKSLDELFSFESVPLVIIEKIFKKLKKNGQNLQYKNKQYMLIKINEKEIEDLENKITKTRTNLVFLVNKLRIFFEGKKIHYTDKEMKNALFLYLESHGFDEYYLGKNTTSLPNKERDNYLIAQFYNKDNDEEIKRSFEHILSGIILMNTVYLPSTVDYNSNNTKFKRLTIYVDTSLLMSLIKLKSIEDNMKADALFDLMPPYAKIKCFAHTVEELKFIIEKTKNHKNTQQIEFFIENMFSENDIDMFLMSIEDEIEKNNIEIDYDSTYESLSREMKINLDFDSEELGKFLSDSVFGYRKKSPLMLQNDIKSIQYVSLMRPNGSHHLLENCEVVFVTTNHNLAYYSNKFFIESDSKYKYNLILSATDFISILWSKSGLQSSRAKELLVEYAQIANVDFTALFQQKLSNKVKILCDNDEIDEKKAALYLEYPVVSYLYKNASNDIDNINAKQLEEFASKYIKNRIDEGISEEKAKLKKESSKMSIKYETEVRNRQKYFKIKAYRKANILSKLLKYLIYFIIYSTIITYNIMNIINFITYSKNLVLCVLGLIGIIGILIFTLITKDIPKYIKKLEDWVYNKIYYNKLGKLIESFEKI